METVSGPSLPHPQHLHPGPGAGSGAPWMCPDSAGTVESRTPGQAQSRARGMGASLPRGPALTRRSWEQVHKLDRIRATEETLGVDALLTPSREHDTHGGRRRRGRGVGGEVGAEGSTGPAPHLEKPTRGPQARTPPSKQGGLSLRGQATEGGAPPSKSEPGSLTPEGRK